MDWLEISVRADGEAAEAISELFNRLNSRGDGTGGAVIETAGFDPVGDDHHPFVTVRTYLPTDLPELAERRRQIEEGVWFLGRLYPVGEVQVRRLSETDWTNAWKAGYRPLRIGRRFLVVPAWLADAGSDHALEPDVLPIILDPGMAFGTGLHPSTQLCLRLLEEVMQPGERVLDAGCGSGILSIAAARLGASAVDAFDIDPIAVRATGENAALNDLSIAINVVLGSGPAGIMTSDNVDGAHRAAAERPVLFQPRPDGAQPAWDVILVNILPHVIIELLAQGLHDYLAPGGRLILAGIIMEREPEVLDALAEHGLQVVGRLTDGDWVGLVAKR